MDQDHQERIRQRAHEIWESEGRPEGREAEHWTRAEEELRGQTGDDQPADALGDPAQAQAPAADPAPKRARRGTKAEPTPYLNDGGA